MNITVAALFIGLFLPIASISAAVDVSIKLSEIIERPNGGAFKMERKYALLIGKTKGEFIAKKMEAWSLCLTLDKTSVVQLKAQVEQLTGHSGILAVCLDKFLVDVPDANVERIDFEWRLNPILWSAYREHGEKFFRKYGTITDIKAAEMQFDNDLDRYLSNSREAMSIAKGIAKKLGATVNSIGCVGESWSFFVNPVGKNSSEFVSLPNFGLKNSQFIHVYFAK